MKPLGEQFAKPEGWIGKGVGWFMNFENKELNRWTTSFLDIQPEDHILEIGFGPGRGIKHVLNTYHPCVFYGIDPSEPMVEAALKRLKSHRDGQVCLMQGEAKELLHFNSKLDKVYAVNNITYWEEPIRILEHIRSMMSEGGRIAITLCPHEEGADDDTTEVLGGQIQSFLMKAGFQHVEIFKKHTDPNDTCCVVGINQ
ncbi:class I SAM-dependent methyltransferase [Thalassobacillus hwangdonensis]|uniref:Class I SAM-dependent methyltransferase n=1 Tax=Thalassobacillus hwangdonensis TaxID=546108 RepID=A0ABW3L2G1_9BACI